MDGWRGKEESEKREKRGGLTGRHTLVLAHKSSVDPFFTFPECDARERNTGRRGYLRGIATMFVDKKLLLYDTRLCLETCRLWAAR